MTMMPLTKEKFWMLEVFLLFQMTSISYGTRWLYFSPARKAPQASAFVPVVVKSSLFNVTNTYGDVSPSYTVFGPSFQPHNRGGKVLNLTLSSDQTQSRIINNPDIYRDKNEIPQDDGSSHPWRPQVTEAPVNKDEGAVQCICVPYYLCKDGFLGNSGGLQMADFLTARTNAYVISSQNETEPHFETPDYVVQLLIAAPQQSCGEQDECCRLQPPDGYNPQGVDYPVATPLPDNPAVSPPFYPPPNKGRQECGIQHAYGVYGRVQNLLYPTDISEFGEYPWQAAILKKVQGDQSLYLCGGTLISSQWVATAAHCLKNARLPKLQIRLGEWDVHRRDEIYPHLNIEVAAIVIHPEFSSQTLQNDLALVRLRDPLNPQLPHVTPACLPHPRQSFVNHRCWVSGWGKDSFGPRGEYQSVLKEVDVPVVPPEYCEMNLRKSPLGPQFRLYPGFLCAGGEPGKDACTGDGGSPLVCNSQGLWYVVGLVSWGIGCGQPGVPGVYVNMAYYREWIDSVTLR